MSKRRKIILGALTAWPLLYIFIFMGIVVSMMFLGPLAADSGAGDGVTALFTGGVGLVFVAHIGTMLLQFGLLFFFLFHVFKRSDLQTNTQLLWALLIFMGGPIGQIIYWWKEIWSDDDLDPAMGGAHPGGQGTARPDVGGTSRHAGHDGKL